MSLCCAAGIIDPASAEFLAALAKMNGSAEEVFEDFTGPGAYTTGAASVPINVSFGASRAFRAAIAGAGAAVQYTNTAVTAQHHGIMEATTGSTAAGAAGALLAATGVVSRILGPNQLFSWYFGARIPVLSDGAQTHADRWGWSTAAASLPTDGWWIEADVTANVNWRGVSRVGGVSTFAAGGASIPVVANTWYLLRSTWDGTTLRFFVKPEGLAEQFIGQTTTVTAAGIAEFWQILKTLGVTARTTLTDFYGHRLLWRQARI